MTIVDSKASKLGQDAIDAIVSSAEKIDFGQIVIKIQDGRIVQVDSLERKRIGNFRAARPDTAEYHI